MYESSILRAFLPASLNINHLLGFPVSTTPGRRTEQSLSVEHFMAPCGYTRGIQIAM